MATIANPGKPTFATLLAELAERARGLHPMRLARAVGPSLERARQQVGPAWERARTRAQPLIERAQPLIDRAQPLREHAKPLLDRIAPPPVTADAAAVERALACGRCDEALALSERLIEASAHEEGAAIARARALAAVGRDEAAGKLLDAWSRRHGTPPALLHAQADLALRKGDAGEAERLCGVAATMAPGRAEVLDRWLDLRQRRGGVVAWLEGLREAAAESGAWLPRVRLGAYCLGQGDADRALRFYADALATGAAGAYTATLTDLARAGLACEAVALAGDSYDPDRHGPWAGLALLDACTASGDTTRGKRVLECLFLRHRHELRNHLQGCANRFLALLAAQARAAREALTQGIAEPPAASAAVPDLRVVQLDRPVWWYGLRWPEWLLPNPAGPQLAVLGFAGEESESALGAAAVIAEEVRLRCGQPTLLVLPVRVGVGIEAPAAEDGGAVRATLAQGEAEGIASLAGTVTRTAMGWRIDAILRDGDGAELARWSPTAATPGLACAGLIAALVEALGGAHDELHRLLPDETLDTTLVCRARLVRLLLAQRGLAPRARVLDDCELFERAIAQAEANPKAEVPALAAIAALAIDHACGSTLHRDAAGAAAGFARGFPRGGTRWLVSPLLLWLAGEQDAFATRRAALLATADGDYREWLEAIGAEADHFVVIED